MASKIALELHLLQSSKFFNRVSSTNLQITQLFSGFECRQYFTFVQSKGLVLILQFCFLLNSSQDLELVFIIQMCGYNWSLGKDACTTSVFFYSTSTYFVFPGSQFILYLYHQAYNIYSLTIQLVFLQLKLFSLTWLREIVR